MNIQMNNLQQANSISLLILKLVSDYVHGYFSLCLDSIIERKEMKIHHTKKQLHKDVIIILVNHQE